MVQTIISHRGNINGPNPEMENRPEYILDALEQGFDCECDLWKIGEELFLGHDSPQYNVEWNFIYKIGLWIHCKNIEAASFTSIRRFYNAFWHQTDDISITGGGHFWTYPGKPLTDKSIAVLPESVPDWDISKAYGVCTDYPLEYKKKTFDFKPYVMSPDKI